MAHIDLNLFRVFEAIYRTKGLTAAARELHLTQPATSNALRRLRTHFDDPLFVREGRRIVPTPVADSLASDVAGALHVLRDSVLRGQYFDPLSSNRKFVIGMRDPFETALLPSLAEALQTLAPEVQIHSVYFARKELSRQLSSGDLSLVIDVTQPTDSSICTQPLFNDPPCVAVRRGHAFSKNRLSLEQYMSARHVAISSSPSGDTLEDLVLAQQGLVRSVAMRTQHYQAACQAVMKTDLVMTLPRAVGHWLSSLFPLELLNLPIQMSSFKMAMYWHQGVEADEGHTWLRQQVERHLHAEFKAALSR